MFLCKYQKNMFAFLSRCHNQQPILSRPNAISLICTPYATLKCHYRLTQLIEAKSKNSIILRELKILFLHSALFLYSFKILLPLLILSFADIKEVTLFHQRVNLLRFTSQWKILDNRNNFLLLILRMCIQCRVFIMFFFSFPIILLVNDCSFQLLNYCWENIKNYRDD